MKGFRNAIIWFVCFLLMFGACYKAYEAGELAKEYGSKYKVALVKLTQAKEKEASLTRQLKYREQAYASIMERIELKEQEATKLREQLNSMLREPWGTGELRDFESMDELLIFLANDDTDKMEYVGNEEVKYVCSHFSFTLMHNAEKQGYRIYPVLMYAMHGYQIVSSHMMCFAVCNKYISGVGEKRFLVAIEPMTDEVTIVGSVYDDRTWIDKWYKFLP